MNIVGLFAGVGGLDLGLSDAGHHAISFSEVNASASAVLKARFPDIPNFGDIATIRDLPHDTDIVTAGFPCQDLSQAGRTIGIGGAKSGLVEHVFRLIDRSGTKIVLLENVSFMLRLDQGSAMHRLARLFEERGFRWAYRVVNSLAFVPQRRERVFMLAAKEFDPADVLLVDEASPQILETDLARFAHGFYWTEGTRGLGWAVDSVPTLKNGSTVGIPSPPAIFLPEGAIVTPDIRDAERLQGLPADWTAPAETVGRRSYRWSLVGNAVTRQVASWIGERLSDHGQYEKSRDTPLSVDSKWPRAARFDGDDRLGVSISAFPKWSDRPSLTAFMQHEPQFLSPRATAGFLSRIERSTLRFPPGFKDGVKSHLDRMHRLNALIVAHGGP